MAEEYERQINDRDYLIRFSIAGDARQLYNLQTSSGANWNEMIQAFQERYLSSDKQDEIYGRLANLRIQYYKREEEDKEQGYLYLLIEKTNSLTKMARKKDRDEEAKVRSLRKEVRGTEWV